MNSFFSRETHIKQLFRFHVSFSSSHGNPISFTSNLLPRTFAEVAPHSAESNRICSFHFQYYSKDNPTERSKLTLLSRQSQALEYALAASVLVHATKALNEATSFETISHCIDCNHLSCQRVGPTWHASSHQEPSSTEWLNPLLDQ